MRVRLRLQRIAWASQNLALRVCETGAVGAVGCWLLAVGCWLLACDQKYINEPRQLGPGQLPNRSRALGLVCGSPPAAR
jgi:hypothetical protein